MGFGVGMDFGGTLLYPVGRLQRLDEIVSVECDTQCPTPSCWKEGCMCGWHRRKMPEGPWRKR